MYSRLEERNPMNQKNEENYLSKQHYPAYIEGKLARVNHTHTIDQCPFENEGRVSWFTGWLDANSYLTHERIFKKYGVTFYGLEKCKILNQEQIPDERPKETKEASKTKT